MPRLLCLGFGYSARAFAATLQGWQITGTSRDGQRGTVRFDRNRILPPYFFAGVTHLLVSIPPDDGGDPAFDRHRDDVAALTNLQWLGYLSTTGVYGNRDGGWVGEGSDLRPTSARSERRCDAEEQWLSLGAHVFRLAGIYGPGRSSFDALRAGTARRFDRPGHAFSRIHVDDLAAVLRASMAQPRPGAIYNVCDDEPAAPADVIAYAAELLGIAAPPLEPFDPATLSPMAQSFWADNKRVSNALIKRELGVVLRYPNYRAGLAAILAAGG
jgi:nucleoside-diphosphate-sugar epimerase